MPRNSQLLDCVFNMKFRMFLQKFRNDTAVFIVIQSTRTVYQNAAGLYTLGSTFQNAPLQGRQGTEVAQLLAPAKVDFVAQDAEARAGGID